MATDVVLHPGKAAQPTRSIWTWLSWAVVAGLAAYFYVTTIPNYFHWDAGHYAQYWPNRWWLVAHVGGGSLALILGPFQFSTMLRKRFVQVHRWMGRLYLAGILVGSVGAIYMGLWVSRLRAFGIALEFLALAWLVTSGMAYLAVMRRQFAVHREWMIRSYVVTFGFVLFRLAERSHILASLGGAMQAVMLAWMCWAVPLLVTDVVLNWRRTLGAKKSATV
ncbi:MAG TPA: DUF2306 domain-containing protein [Acidobacteriaceae bacterium]|jgi:hypothetical protein